MDPVGHQKKIIKTTSVSINAKNNQNSEEVDLSSIKEASKDSVRAIMLIRAFRIRGHLIANLDPQSRKEYPELKPEILDLQKRSSTENIFDGVLGLLYVDLNPIFEILKNILFHNLIS